jgi:hypothetical protein
MRDTTSSGIPLRYGIVVTGDTVKAWELECIRNLAATGSAALVCLLRQAASERSHGTKASSFERFCAKLDLPSQSTTSLAEIAPIESDVMELYVDGQDAGRWERRLRALDLDFLLLFGDPKFGLRLRASAKYGLWYFAHSDLTRFSTNAPCFWEIYHNHDVAGAMLLKLEDNQSAGIVLKSAFLSSTQNSFEQNTAAVFGELPKWPARVCRDISRGAARYFDRPPLASPNRHYRLPNSLEILAFRALQRKNAVAKRIRATLCVSDWSVGRIEGPPSQFIDHDRHVEMTHLYAPFKGKFLADPCILTQDGRRYVFFEEYHHDLSRGRVVACELSATGAGPAIRAIEEPHHLSYPHVFEHEGNVYCIPGSESTNKVCLYRSSGLPDQWEYVDALIETFCATDITLIKRNATWWLFCTSSETYARGHNSHLYLWFADDLFGPWKAHANNPVKIDVRSARPAGKLFSHDACLYRPAQDCSRTYGGAITINRIDRLTETEFQETVAGIVRPPLKAYTRGIHTPRGRQA